MKITTILFDLDGTLLNTLGDIHACINQALIQNNCKERSLEEIKSFIGNGIKIAIEKAVFPYIIEEEKLLKAVNDFKNAYKENMNKYTRPYDGIKTTLDELKKNNYKIAVISNKYDEAVKNLCKEYFGDYIDIAVGESENTKKKPNIDGILKVCKELNIKIDECIFIGDSEVDIKTAHNAEIPCISVLWGYKDKEFLLANNAKYLCEEPKQIINLIKTIEKKRCLI